MRHYYLVYKPYNMLSQFTKEVPEHYTLADLDFAFPKDVYPVGRLDQDSEGLLILTNDRALTDYLLNPKNEHPRTYLAQVEQIPTPEALAELERGVEINVNGKNYQTLPARALLLAQAPAVPDRNPPIRYRAAIPTAWIQLELIEGKNRQVRKMTAKVGYPTLRLLRTKIGKLELPSDMLPGEVREVSNLRLIFS